MQTRFLSLIVGLVSLLWAAASAEATTWTYPTTSTYAASVTDNGNVLASDNVPGASITVSLPTPASVGQGWTLSFSEGNGRGIILNAPSNVFIFAGQKQNTSLTVPSNTNYEFVTVQSDGTNFRLLSATYNTALWNGLTPTGSKGWTFLFSLGYSSTAADNGGILSSQFTGGSTMVTLPSTPLLPNGWKLSLYPTTVNPITVQLNSVSGGTLIGPNGVAVTSYVVSGGGNFTTISFDGSSFHVMRPDLDVHDFHVLNYGAFGNSVTDDSQAIANTFKACSAAGGGNVVFDPTGAGYVIQHANLIAAQETGPCAWKGVGGHYWPATFYDNIAADWMAKGAWIWCQDAANSCAEMTTPGQSVVGLNFWYTQPTPTSTTCSTAPCPFGTGWTPNTYPATIKADATTNFFKIDDNVIVNAYQCLDIEGPSSGVANMYSSITNNGFGCLFKDALLHMIDNTVIWRGNHDFLLWYQGSTQVLGYVEGGPGGLALDAQYVANLIMSDSEFVWKRLGVLLTDACVTNGFGNLCFAGANWQVHAVQWNEVCQVMKVATTGTHFNGGPVGNAVGINIFDNIGVAADTSTSGIPTGGSSQCAAATPNMFDLGSDNVSLMMNGVNVAFVNTLVNLGAGVSGFVEVNGLSVQKYSAFTSNLPLFNGASNAAFELCGDQFRSLGASTNPGPYTFGGFRVPCSLGSGGQITGQGSTSRQLCYGTDPTNPSAAIDFGTNYRWCLRTDNTPESGSNAGSNFSIDRYNDAGVYIDTPVDIIRSTGNVFMNNLFYPEQVLVSTLPSCGGGQVGALALVTDQSAAESFGSVVGTGGGSNRVLALCNGVNWVQH